MKVCSKCRKEGQFNKNKSAPDGLSYYCKTCEKEAHSVYYLKNKKSIKTKTKAYNYKVRDKVRDFVIEYLLTHSCSDCGEEDIIVLEFDHLDNKRYSIASMISSYKCMSTVQKEIAKCQVLCSNCHKRKTAKDQGWYKLYKNAKTISPSGTKRQD